MDTSAYPGRPAEACPVLDGDRCGKHLKATHYAVPKGTSSAASNPRAQPAYHQGGAARYEPGAASTIRAAQHSRRTSSASSTRWRCATERQNGSTMRGTSSHSSGTPWQIERLRVSENSTLFYSWSTFGAMPFFSTRVNGTLLEAPTVYSESSSIIVLDLNRVT